MPCARGAAGRWNLFRWNRAAPGAERTPQPRGELRWLRIRVGVNGVAACDVEAWSQFIPNWITRISAISLDGRAIVSRAPNHGAIRFMSPMYDVRGNSRKLPRRQSSQPNSE